MADGLSILTDGLWTQEYSLNIAMATEIESDIELLVEMMDQEIAPTL